MGQVRLEDQPPHVQAVIKHAAQLVGKGIEVYFKFTCLSCKARCTFTEKNSFYKWGECDQCKKMTDVRDKRANLNFMAVAVGDAALNLADEIGMLGTKPPTKES